MDNQKNTQKNKLNELVDTALDNLRGLVDANTVIGQPIVTVSGTTVIPVSKVSIGIAGGGNDYSQKAETASGKASFSGGGGAVTQLVGVELVGKYTVCVGKGGRGVIIGSSKI